MGYYWWQDPIEAQYWNEYYFNQQYAQGFPPGNDQLGDDGQELDKVDNGDKVMGVDDHEAYINFQQGFNQEPGFKNDEEWFKAYGGECRVDGQGVGNDGHVFADDGQMYMDDDQYAEYIRQSILLADRQNDAKVHDT